MNYEIGMSKFANGTIPVSNGTSFNAGRKSHIYIISSITHDKHILWYIFCIVEYEINHVRCRFRIGNIL